jgi:hypothetical protein
MSLPAAVVLRQQEIDDLEAEVSVVAARLNRAHADLVDLTRRVLEAERWAGGGIRSVQHWLVLHAGLSPARAHDVVRLARRTAELPTTVAGMGSGQVSVDQAAVVARYAPASHEGSIGELAPMTTVPQLRRALSRYQFGSADEAAGDVGTDGRSPDPVGRDDRDVPGTEAFAVKAPELSMSYGDGRFRLRYSAPADIGALVEQAVREAKDALFTAGHTRVSYADGLAEIASRSMATPRGDRVSRRDRIRGICGIRGFGRVRGFARIGGCWRFTAVGGGGQVGRSCGAVPGVRASLRRRVVGRWSGRHPGVVGGEVRLRRSGAAGVGGRRHPGQCGSRAADRPGPDASAGGGP